jgi:hypothetical protein
LTSISGEKFCVGFGHAARSRDFWCYGSLCDASLSIRKEMFIDYKFSLQVLGGKYGSKSEYLEVLVNDVPVGNCDPGKDEQNTNSPSWYNCGVYKHAAKVVSTISLRNVEVVDGGNAYNRVDYTVYGRVGYLYDATVLSYALAGNGYCKDWVYLPEGGYPKLLSKSNPLYNEDRIEECMNRCVYAAKQGLLGSHSSGHGRTIRNHAFYIGSYQRCACSSGACSIRYGSGYYTSYYIVSGNVEDVKPIADLFAIATICPTESEINEIEECYDVTCGGYCSATRTLPDGNSNYVIHNCLAGENKYNVYLRLCNGLSSPTVSPTVAPSLLPSRVPTASPTQPPTLPPTTSPTKSPTLSPTTLLPTRTPTWSPTLLPTIAPTQTQTDQWSLSGCIEWDTKITTPTLKNFSISSSIDDATVQCMAACQALDICEYWTLEVQTQICHLKKTNLEKSLSLTSISGEKFCVGFGYSARSRDFWCYGSLCNASLSIGKAFQDNQFSLQVLGGTYGSNSSYLEVRVNGVHIGQCDPAKDEWNTNSPSWYDCGVYKYATKVVSTIILKNVQVNDGRNAYNRVNYTIYGRVGYRYDATVFSYALAGNGYCSDWVYLPEGGYPNLLSKSYPLYNKDRIKECMNRCVYAAKQGLLGSYSSGYGRAIRSHAFYITSYQRCACSSGTCSIRYGSGFYTSYYIVSGNVEDIEPLADLFAIATCCPNESEIDEVEQCSDVACGGYCSARRTLPDGNSNYVINNCLAEGNRYNIYLRLCNGLSSPTLSPTLAPSLLPSRNPTRAPTQTPTFPPTSPTKSPTLSPTSTPTQSPIAPTQSPTDQWSLSAKGLSYALAGAGYCSDWVYLPEGGYPNLLSKIDPLYNEDRIEECMNRCAYAARKGLRGIRSLAFYILTSDKRCACSSGACVRRYGSVSYTSYYTIFPTGRRYALAGDGYCSDWVYLPDGGYPNLLSKSDPLYTKDRIEECMKRCTEAARKGLRGIRSLAFYIRTSNQRCACSSGACSTRRGSGSYTSYYTVSPTVSSYALAGDGYCSDYVYLPEGGYPNLLKKSDPLYNVDRIEECMNRCVYAAKKGLRGIRSLAFYVRNSNQRCACSSGACSTRHGSGSYTSYYTISPTVLSYALAGNGYCSDWMYLPEGGYPNLLSKSDPLYNKDRIEECMNRCVYAARKGLRGIRSLAFYIENNDQRCACSSGACSRRVGSGYTSYNIV